MDCKEVNVSEVYTELKFVDRGTFGQVFKVVEKGGQVLALKVHTMKEVSFPGDFARELRCLTRLRDHPNIVRIHKAFLAMGVPGVSPSPAFTMDYVPVTISDMTILHSVGLPVSFIAMFSLDVARALVYIHEMGFIHRDLTLRNLLLEGNLTTKIADFGASREVHPRKMSGGLVTLTYRAPELAMNKTSYTTASDNWSLGSVIISAVENRMVFLPADWNSSGNKSEAEVEFATFQLVRLVVDLPDYKYSIKAPEKLIPTVMRQPVVKAVAFGLLEPSPAHRMTAQELLNNEEWCQLAHITKSDRDFVSKRYQQCRPMQCIHQGLAEAP